eukprot:362120-Chlamydomonas_euryale.AAC.7
MGGPARSLGEVKNKHWSWEGVSHRDAWLTWCGTRHPSKDQAQTFSGPLLHDTQMRLLRRPTEMTGHSQSFSEQR